MIETLGEHDVAGRDNGFTDCLIVKPLARTGMSPPRSPYADVKGADVSKTEYQMTGANTITIGRDIRK